MSANVAVVQKAYELFGKGDVPGIIALLAPDVAWEYGWGGRSLKWYEPRKGAANVVGFFQTLADFEFLRFEPINFLSGGNQVAVPVQLELRVKANGRIIRDLEMHLWTFDEAGRVSAFRHLCDTLQFAEMTE